MRKVKVEIKGIAPLLINKYVMQAEGQTTRKKTNYVPEEEAEKRVYRNKDGKCFIPWKNIKASMSKAAVDFKMSGRKSYKDYVKAGIFSDDMEIPLTPSEYIIHEEPVCIQGSMVPSWRPKFENWSCLFIIDVVDDMIDLTALKEILESAGKYKGLGSYRPEFGRFEVTKFEKVKEE